MTTPKTYPQSPSKRKQLRALGITPNAILKLVRGQLQKSPELSDQIAWDAWLTDETIRAEKVALFKDYFDGDHRSYLTPEMADMLRAGQEAAGSSFSMNHMEKMVTTVTNRLKLTGVNSDNSEASTWAAGVMEANRIDGLQTGVYDAALRDADTFILAEWDNQFKRVRWSHEDAFDGIEGMVVVYGDDQTHPAIAIKIWQMKLDNQNHLQTRARVNIYYPDRVERYVERNNGLVPYSADGVSPVDKWQTIDGKPVGLPVIHFRNRGKRFGKSQLEDVVPLQDVVNRTLISMVMAAELSAFMIRILKGIRPPEKLQPGMWISLYFTHPKTHAQAGQLRAPNEAEQKWLDSVKAEALPQGELTQYINQAQFVIDAMYEITGIPRGASSPNASGEALKQRGIDLLGTAERCQTSFGNSWEDLIKLSWQIQAAYNTDAPPPSTTWSAAWRSAEMRNKTEDVDNTLKVADRLDERTVLEQLAPVFGWDEKKIDQILDARSSEQAGRLAALGSRIPTFG